MKATVCELGNNREQLAQDWERLVAHVKAEASDLVVLPEMAFAPWFAASRDFDANTWQAAVIAHDMWIQRLHDLAPAVVIGSRPVNRGTQRHNQGFTWTAERGYQPIHTKYYLPDEPDFWEASWYERGDGDFTPFEIGTTRIGMLICTELWFMDRARAYGQAGIHLLIVPRATPTETVDKWLAGGRAAAVIAGAFALSSNPITSEIGTANLGGQGWAIGPDGEVLGLTSRERPFLTVEIDLEQAHHAKQTYPRYVRD